MHLDQEQKTKLIETYENEIDSFTKATYKRYKDLVPFMEYEDFRQEAVLAFLTFVDEKCTNNKEAISFPFYTFMYKICESILRMQVVSIPPRVTKKNGMKMLKDLPRPVPLDKIPDVELSLVSDFHCYDAVDEELSFADFYHTRENSLQKEAIYLSSNNLTTKQIAEEMEVSMRYVQKMLKDAKETYIEMCTDDTIRERGEHS